MTALTAQTRAILFDHDGTLIDSERIHFAIWQEIANEFGASLTEDFYYEVMAGIPVNQNARDLVAHFSLSTDAKSVAQKKHDLTRKFLTKQAFPLMEGAKQTLKTCYDMGFTLAVVTGGSGMSVRRTIEMYGLEGMFRTIVAAEDVENSKPAPDCYLKALNQLGYRSEQAIAVEDTVHGMRAALHADLRCVAIPGRHAEEHDFSAATVIYSSLQEWLERELAR